MRANRIVMLAVLVLAYQGSASAQSNSKMGDLADQLRTALKDEPVVLQQQGAVTLTSGADAMFASGTWELKPDAPLLGKLAPILAKLQHTEIEVDGYTDNVPIGPDLQNAGITNNLDLSCKRAANVVSHLVALGVNPELLSVHCFGATHPVASNATPDGQAKNRRVGITLIGDGT